MHGKEGPGSFSEDAEPEQRPQKMASICQVDRGVGRKPVYMRVCV